MTAVSVYYICKFKFTEDLRGEMMVPAAKKLEDLIHLAELCVDLLQQNEEHYAEVRKRVFMLSCLSFLPLPLYSHFQCGFFVLSFINVVSTL